jgi:HK97 family phage portal protein
MAKPSILRRMLMRGLGVKDAGTDMSLAEYLEYVLRGGGRTSVTGRNVGWQQALQVTTALRCTQVLADAIATVPLNIVREQKGERVVDKKHPLYKLFMVRANAWQTGLAYRETVGYHLALAEAHYAFKVYNTAGDVIELLPLIPGTVSLDTTAQEPTFRVRRPVTGEVKTMTSREIFYVPGASWNGTAGVDPMLNLREALGLSLATEEAHARLHRNGGKPGGLYSVEGTLDGNDYEKLRAWIEKNVEGVENSFKTLVLDRAAKFTPLAMTGVDSEHLATRRHQIEEVCRGMGVLPIMVGHANEQTTFASASEMFLAHAVHTARPRHRRFEAAVNANLLSPQDRANDYSALFDDTEMLRMNPKDSAEYFSKALGSGGAPGWLTPNEVRRATNPLLPDLPDGDKLPQGSNAQNTVKPTGTPQV